jgi:hypothetical protein
MRSLMRSHSPLARGGRGDSLCADESPSNSPFARGRIELSLQRLHDGAALPLLFQRSGQGWFVRDVPTSLQSRRDDGIQAGATPLYSAAQHQAPKGRQNSPSPLRGFICWWPTVYRGVAPAWTIGAHHRLPPSLRDFLPILAIAIVPYCFYLFFLFLFVFSKSA